MKQPQLKRVLMWALTYRCNMSCEYCFLKEKIVRWDELNDELCISIAKRIASGDTWKPKAVWLTGGEPTIRKCLPTIVTILENACISTIITTNGLCNTQIIDSLLNSKPRGINISLESFETDVNNENRGHTEHIIESINYIGKNKDMKTILGVSCVISPERIPNLIDFAGKLKNIGVEYLSMNPIIGGKNQYKKKDFNDLLVARKIIIDEIGLKIPSEFYFSLVEDCHLMKSKYHLSCPAGTHYMFISPWGEIFPCSNELWQREHTGCKGILDYKNLELALDSIRQVYNTDSITMDSACFGDRCIGCWKLYYDTIFTN